MTRMTRLSCMTAALLGVAFLSPGFTIGNAIAQDSSETQQASPDATGNQANPDATTNQQDQSKEEANSKNSSESSAKQAEPDCNN